MNRKVCITLSLIFLLDPSDTCFLPEFKDHFDSHDYNGNGVWDQDEFCEYAKGEEECENAMNELDLNRNGTITCQEFWVASLALELVDNELGKALKSIFTHKIENCGEISLLEMRTFLMADYNHRSEDEVVSMLKNFDLDQDGDISCYEFLEVLYLDLERSYEHEDNEPR